MRYFTLIKHFLVQNTHLKGATLPLITTSSTLLSPQDSHPIPHPAALTPPEHPTRSPTIAPTPASTPADTFNQSVDADLRGLTKSQRLFTIGTRIDPRSLSISTDVEFYLFMDMRSERGWATFNMSAHKWVTETSEYNRRLTDRNTQLSQSTIPKNPRALLDKLVMIESKVIERLATGNYSCKCWHRVSVYQTHLAR